MSRRAALVVLVFCFAVLAAAVVPWRVSSDALRASVSARLHDISGLELTAAGAAAVAVLPVPRLTFEAVTLTTADRTPVVRGGTLRGALRILPLLAGRLEFAELSLADAVIDVEFGGARSPWDETIATLRARLDPGQARGHVARLVLNGAKLRLHDRRTGFETMVHGIHMAADWPTPSALLAVAGSMTWRGEVIQIRAASLQPDALVAGRASPLTIDVSAPLAGLALTGELGLHDDHRLVGRTTFTTRSLRDFSLWSGVPLPLSHLIGAFGLDGDVHVGARGISWPAVRLTLGNDKLEGALSWRADGERRTVTSTLAADRLDLTGFAASFAGRRPSAAGWSANAFEPPPQSGTDLDLRLSASAARIGPVRLDDLAANFSVKPGRYEASVNRVTINKGSAKGRAVLVNAGDGIEVKGQSTFERIDVAALLADLGLSRWGSGSAQGQLALEGSGDDPVEIVRSLDGRGHITIRQGELIGVGLAEMVRRSEGQSGSAPVAWRGGRTPFEQASLHVAFADGIAEITDAKMSGTGVRAALQGRTSLADRTLAAKASVENAVGAPGAGSAILLDITGPWSSPTVVPSARSVTQRPDAAVPAAAVQ